MVEGDVESGGERGGRGARLPGDGHAGDGASLTDGVEDQEAIELAHEAQVGAHCGALARLGDGIAGPHTTHDVAYSATHGAFTSPAAVARVASFCSVCQES